MEEAGVRAVVQRQGYRPPLEKGKPAATENVGGNDGLRFTAPKRIRGKKRRDIKQNMAASIGKR